MEQWFAFRALNSQSLFEWACVPDRYLGRVDGLARATSLA